jgi:hypothetical protein
MPSPLLRSRIAVTGSARDIRPASALRVQMAPRCVKASTLSRRGHSHPKPSSHCIVARDMTRPTTIFSTLLTSSKLSPSATGVSSVAAATSGCRAESHSEEKGQGERGVRAEGDADPPSPQPSQHRASRFSPITLFPGLPHPCPHDPCACVSSLVA